MKQVLAILLITVSIQLIKSETQEETNHNEQTNDDHKPLTQLKNKDISINYNEFSDNDFNDKVVYKNTFQQRIKMLPIKVLLQLMKTKKGVSDGLSKTMQGTGIMEGLQESSGALFNLFKDGVGDINTLVFGN